MVRTVCEFINRLAGTTINDLCEGKQRVLWGDVLLLHGNAKEKENSSMSPNQLMSKYRCKKNCTVLIKVSPVVKNVWLLNKINSRDS